MDNNNKDIKSAFADYLTTIENASSAGESIESPGLKTGFIDLDSILGGLHPGELVLISGTPVMNKTELATNILEHVALVQKKPVAKIAIAGESFKLITDLAASIGRISIEKLKRMYLEEEDWGRLTSTITLLTDAPFYLQFPPRMTLDQVVSSIRDLQQEHGLSAVMIDNVDMITLNQEPEYRPLVYEKIMRELKSVCAETGVVLFLISNCSLKVEDRINKRPILSDLRPNDALQIFPDRILFVYQDEMYDEESVDRGLAEIIVAKNFGEVGSVRLACSSIYCRYQDFTPEVYEQNDES